MKNVSYLENLSILKIFDQKGAIKFLEQNLILYIKTTMMQLYHHQHKEYDRLQNLRLQNLKRY